MKRNPLTADKELTKEHHSVAAKTVRVADLTIGEGIPKICMGLAAAEFDLVLDMHRQIREEEADLLEWRTDYLLGGQYADIEGINRTLAAIAAEDARPVVLTLRTESEGGQAALSSREYREIIRSYIMESDAKVIDIEAFDKEGSADRDVTAFLVSLAHENGTRVIRSFHDFGEIMCPQNYINTKVFFFNTMNISNDFHFGVTILWNNAIRNTFIDDFYIGISYF